MNDPRPIPADPAATDQRGAMLRLLDRPLSAQALEADARAAAQPVEAETRGATGVLMFRLGEESLALPARSLRRVNPLVAVSPIPLARSPLLRGMCSIRGELILCADLHQLLGITRGVSPPAPGSGDPRRMIVIGPGDAPWVFEADAVMGIERVDPGAFIPVPVTLAGSTADFAAGLFDAPVGRMTVLDDKRVLAGLKAALS
ncbi:MAG: chemotaxis protein CheW [Phycisphaerales bacterium]|nr:chemotaxis protein CheW [Phycisphaerales bacterium]